MNYGKLPFRQHLKWPFSLSPFPTNLKKCLIPVSANTPVLVKLFYLYSIFLKEILYFHVPILRITILHIIY